MQKPTLHQNGHIQSIYAEGITTWEIISSEPRSMAGCHLRSWLAIGKCRPCLGRLNQSSCSAPIEAKWFLFKYSWSQRMLQGSLTVLCYKMDFNMGQNLSFTILGTWDLMEPKPSEGARTKWHDWVANPTMRGRLVSKTGLRNVEWMLYVRFFVTCPFLT